ncbi:F0F1 ATP synthase subunit delta [Candidatus Dependentiae bacterium]|nr:F0F1 ATP synthase subunit delta [Candidatus Dependentiae bacterium]
MNDKYDILAKKYAKAFINLYSDTITEELAERIHLLGRYFHEHRRALLYVQITKLDGDATRKRFDTLFMSAGVDHMFASLIDMLLGDRRIFLLPRIMNFIYIFYLEKRSIIHFTIESAMDLDDQELAIVKNFLEEQTGKQVRYRVKRNPGLIAGIKMYSDTLYFEHSIRKYLRILSTTT